MADRADRLVAAAREADLDAVLVTEPTNLRY
ncbi:MAG: aminopeptidase P family N-terminal domain-containing protein, partial [Solirubrobacterales bacterium]|nr:aminopeptidase P family N-terminal domain-containing protein [Solirubrobacterales bacterium]